MSQQPQTAAKETPAAPPPAPSLATPTPFGANAAAAERDRTPEEIMRAMPKGAPPEKCVLQGRRFQERSIKQLEYALHVEAGHTLADLLKPSYWQHVAKELKPMTKICAMAENQTWYAEMIVFNVGTAWAQVKVLGEPIIITDLSELRSPAHDFEAVNMGLHLQWCVRARSNQQIKKDSLPTEDAANAWIREFLRAQKVAA